MLKRYEIANGSGVVESQSPTAHIEVFVNPDPAEREYLVKTLNVDEHTLNSALDPDELSRVEFEADHAAIIMKRPKNYSSEEEFLFKVTSIGFFVFKDRLVVVTLEDYPLFEGKQFNKVTRLFDIVLRIVSRTIFHYHGHLKVINQISAEIEEKITTSMENKYLLNMFTLEKSLVYYLDAISANEVVIERLKNSAGKLGLGTECVEFLDDLLIENRQCYKQADIYSSIVSGLMDARASIVNNNLNILIKRLTIINIVFMPLNLLAGIGGMSEFTMMTRNFPWPFAYAAFLAGMVVLGVITYAIMTRIGSERERVHRRRLLWLRKARS